MKKTYDEPIMAVTRFEASDAITFTVSTEFGVDDWEELPVAQQ